jgi:tetratricopeptide (TPR) repeat protein
MNPGNLIVVVGLPGAGKSTLLKKIRRSITGICVHDFHANAMNDLTNVPSSRHFRALVEALVAGHDCAIADIAFCVQERRDNLCVVISKEIPETKIEFKFLEKSFEKCERNIRYRNPYNPEPALKKLRDFYPQYVIPKDAEIAPIWQPSTSPPKGVEFLVRAWNTSLGEGDEVKDEEEAIRILRQAVELDLACAYNVLADWMVSKADLSSNSLDESEKAQTQSDAMEILKEGCRKGHGACFVQMAHFYEAAGRKEDASKCWRKYFKSRTFLNDEDHELAHLLDYDYGSLVRTEAVRYYFRAIRKGDLPEDKEAMFLLLPFRNEILEDISDFGTFLSQTGQSDAAEKNGQLFAFVKKSFEL